MQKWIMKLTKHYCLLRQKDQKLTWLNTKNFLFRIFEKDSAYLKLIDSDTSFASNAKKLIFQEIVKNKLTVKNIQDSILFLKMHISKNEERIKFLIAFPILFTFVLIYQKLELLEKILPNPFNIILIIFFSILTFLALAERTKLTYYKHCLEELIIFLESFSEEMSNKSLERNI